VKSPCCNLQKATSDPVVPAIQEIGRGDGNRGKWSTIGLQKEFSFKFWLRCCRIFELIRSMTTLQTMAKILLFINEMTFQSHTPYLTISRSGNILRQLNVSFDIFLIVSPPLSTKLYIYYGDMIRAAEFKTTLQYSQI
jgi:hypothetical protein